MERSETNLLRAWRPATRPAPPPCLLLGGLLIAFGCDAKIAPDGWTGCETAADCAAGMACLAGACVPVDALGDVALPDAGGELPVQVIEIPTCPKGACDDGDPCTQDDCTPESGCTHTPDDSAWCDDGDPCTTQDHCGEGGCAGKKIACTCAKDSDCAALDNGDPCDGTLRCDTAQLPYTCTVDVATIVDCDTSGDPACLRNTCDPKTGGCAPKPRPDGTACDDGDACSQQEACFGGACSGGTIKHCDDGQTCTLDLCDPKTAACSAKKLADATACDDGDACTQDDACAGGTCKAGAMNGCDDDNPCTKDTCDAASGKCGSEAVADGGACDDGNPCTGGEACGEGKCGGGKLLACDDGEPCTMDGCDPKTGNCASTPVSDGETCSDDSACTSGDACKQGACVPGEALECDDGKPCTVDACDPATGECAAKPAKKGATCDDGDACTPADQCDGEGGCGGPPKTCAGDACRVGVCDSKTGKCGQEDKPSGEPCDDGQPCTLTDQCDGKGKCVGANPKTCAGDGCNTGVCDTKTGGCGVKPKANGTKCDDGDACTLADACKSGKCLGANPKTCPGDACNTGSCDTKTGGCSKKPKANGTKCDDGNACTKGDQCGSGVCKPGTYTCECTVAKQAAQCNDKNPCTEDLCVSSGTTWTCKNKITANAACTDGNACTKGDKCTSGGACKGTAVVCTGGTACKSVACDAKTGKCVAKVLAGKACSDNKKCTVGDVCGSNGVCNGKPKVCKDNALCTTDSCSAGTGKCVFAPNTLPCEDGSKCTLKDTCKGGKCGPGQKLGCDDKNACTKDWCDPKAGCKHAPLTVSCSDGNACTAGDKCSGGKCAPGKAVSCNDGNPCTKDSCSKAKGCQHTALAGTACDDGNKCTAGEKCNAAKACAGGSAPSCKDANPCTIDTCNPKTGCVHTKSSSGSCNDGNACTTGDKCSGGTCKGGKPPTCNDNKACTKDSCDSAKGCVFKPLTGNACNDGKPCTINDKCQGGVCKAGPTKSCSDGKPCTKDTCNAANGACVHTTLSYKACCAALTGKKCSWTDSKGIAWGLVPSGSFYMGCRPGQKVCASQDKPQHKVTITKAFWLGIYEVTVARYDACRKAGKCSPALATGGGGSNLCAGDAQNNWTSSGPKSGRASHPANCVTFSQAQAFCKWVGGFLPTSAQWELAARGRCRENGSSFCSALMRYYPWGDAKPTCGTQAVFFTGTPAAPGGWGCGKGGTWAAGAGSKSGAGPYGHRDMVGNVWEWVADYWSAGFYGTSAATKSDPKNTTYHAERVVRGSGFNNVHAEGLEATHRFHFTAAAASGVLGFRCARSYP